MEKLNQKEIILAYLKDLNDWQFEYAIRAINTKFGWIGARGDRNVRELIEEEKLDHDMKGKYRIVKHKEVEAHKPLPLKPKIEIRMFEGRPLAVLL